MNARELAQSLHGVKAGKRFQCRCPTGAHKHGDRSRSLSIWEADDQWICLKCFSGCSRDEILSSIGLQVRDLFMGDFHLNPEWERRKSDKERLEILEHRLGLFIMLQNVDTEKRSYYAAAERNTAVDIAELRRKINPVAAYYERRERITQYLISEYGMETLWDCIEQPKREE